jgi:hypothetical protein
VPRASIENRRSWTVLLLLRVRRLDRVSKARRADGGLLFKTPWSCVCVCVGTRAVSGVWRLVVSQVDSACLRARECGGDGNSVGIAC